MNQPAPTKPTHHRPVVLPHLARLLTARQAQRNPEREDRPRSLRLRLALWYGALLAAALLLFGTLVTVLTSNAILQSVDTGLGAEARIAQLDLDRTLSLAPPYWPTTLNLDVVDAYRDPGVTVAIFDAQGQVRYRSATGTTLPVGPGTAAFAAALAGRMSVLSTHASGEPVRVVVVPIRAPTPTGARPATGAASSPPGSTATGPGAATSGPGPIIGVLLVAKSLRDVDATLLLLRSVLLLTGLAILATALLGGWAIARRVLHPLDLIAMTARHIAAGTARGVTAGPLRHRMPRPPGDDELAHLVDTLNDMLAALENATAVQRRFVADASHELRAPLTTIQGNLAFVQQHANDLPAEERQVMLGDAHSEAQRLARLVDDLLLLARADASSDEAMVFPADGAVAAAGSGSKTTQERTQLIELDRVVLQLVRQLRGRLAAEDSRLKLQLGHIEPARVRGDEETLRRVALILLDNAMKYTVAKGEDPAATGQISVGIERAGTEVVLRVQDTGIGIAAADLPHIFERFYRADTARSRQGTGLGLAIAQMLVERLHGHISVESVPGRGSTFSVWLPAADAAPIPARA